MSTTDIESRQIAREDCRVGDWVEGQVVPEWREEIEPQTFSPGAIDFAPGEDDFGGMSPATKPDLWTFAPEEMNGTRVWRRRS